MISDQPPSQNVQKLCNGHCENVKNLNIFVKSIGYKKYMKNYEFS